jgi:protoporphyrinogen IX oxidase
MFNTLVALHIIGIILWTGGLFMLTRHVGMHAELDSTPQKDLKVYESKSYYMGVLPGFLLTLATGLWMFFDKGAAYYLSVDEGVWGSTFHLKFTLVVLLIAADQFFHMRMRRFHQKGEGKRKLFMAIHGVSALFFIVIVLLMKGRYFV